MIPHIVIFHKQFDLSLANHTESPVLSASFLPLRTGFASRFFTRFPSRLFAVLALYYDVADFRRPLLAAAFPAPSHSRRLFMTSDDRSALQFRRMTETPIPQLVLSLAAPTILSMLITSIYNLADTFFRGPDLHQCVRCRGRCFQPDGHHPGAGLYAGPRGRHHHQPQPGQPRHHRRHPVCVHQLFSRLWCLAWCWPWRALAPCPTS